MTGNPDAAAFFEASPSEPYWYHSPTLRVSNPRLKPWQWTSPVPWPT